MTLLAVRIAAGVILLGLVALGLFRRRAVEARLREFFLADGAPENLALSPADGLH